MNKSRIGKLREAEAARYLRAQGYVLLEQNYRCRLGEIDIVAREGAYVVFIEVKYRADARYGYPQESVDKRKIARLHRAAQYYLLERYKNGKETPPCRFDVVAILGDEITLIRNAF